MAARTPKLLVAGVVALLAAVLLVTVSLRGAGGAAPGVQSYDVTDQSHISGPVVYPQDPPVGGRHSPSWLNCGAYSAPVANEMAVHSMEHGAVWITYRPDLPAGQVDALRKLAQDPAGKGYVLVSPYPSLPADTPAVASAWGKQLRLRRFDEPALRAFVVTYANGPQTPEPGAPCSGGVMP